MRLVHASAATQMASHRDIPGFYYDEEKRRYFRESPKPLAYMSSDQLGQHQSDNSRGVVPTPSSSTHSERYSKLGLTCGAAAPGFVPKSVFDLASHMPLSRDTRLLQQTLPQTLACRAKSIDCTPFEPERLTLLHPNFHLSHIRLNKRGDMAVISYKLVSARETICDLTMFDIFHVSFMPSERKTGLLQITAEHPYVESESVEISAHGMKSDIIVFFDGCKVVAQTIEQAKGDRRPSAFWWNDRRSPSPKHVDPDDPICCLPRFSGGVLCAVSYVKGNANEVSPLVLQNNHTLRLLRTYLMRSKIKSLAFREDPLLLYAGTRSGVVVSWDLRRSGKSKALSFTIDKEGSTKTKARPSVIRLHSIDDYIITNCMDSRLLLWDCRMLNHHILSYAEHRNSHYHCQSVVNESQGFVAGVQEDKSICIWSVWSGKLLRRIPMSEYVGDTAAMDGVLPVIAHTERLSGVYGTHALLVGTPEGIVTFT